MKYTGTSGEDFVFAAAVDTTFPIQDNFYTENRLYEKYGSSAREIALVGVIAGLLWIVRLCVADHDRRSQGHG